MCKCDPIRILEKTGISASYLACLIYIRIIAKYMPLPSGNPITAQDAGLHTVCQETRSPGGCKKSFREKQKAQICMLKQTGFQRNNFSPTQ